MWFQVLGPVRAWCGGHEIDLGSPKQRLLFGMLLIEANRFVTVDTLTELLWAFDAPPTARRTVQVYLSRLRGSLAPCGAWNFAGHFHSSGPLTYNIGYAALIAVPSGIGFTFDAKGKAKGWLDGGGNLDWNRAGVNPAIASAWSQIRSSDWSSKGRASLDVIGLIGNLIDAAVFVIQVQQTVDSYSA